MQAELYSVQKLATELERDRKALARELEGLTPDEETKDRAGRVTRKYRLARVVAHLYATGDTEFDDQRQRLAAAQAERVEAENALRRGQLADVVAVNVFWTDHIAAARKRVLAMGAKLGPQLTNVGDASVIAAAIRAEATSALAELADYEPPTAGDSGPADVDQEGSTDVGAAAGPDRQPVGGRRKKALKRE